MILKKIAHLGIMTVYERNRRHETWVPKYVVGNDRTGRLLEEFRRKASALKWAEANKSG